MYACPAVRLPEERMCIQTSCMHVVHSRAGFSHPSSRCSHVLEGALQGWPGTAQLCAAVLQPHHAATPAQCKGVMTAALMSLPRCPARPAHAHGRRTRNPCHARKLGKRQGLEGALEVLRHRRRRQLCLSRLAIHISAQPALGVPEVGYEVLLAATRATVRPERACRPRIAQNCLHRPLLCAATLQTQRGTQDSAR